METLLLMIFIILIILMFSIGILIGMVAATLSVVKKIFNSIGRFLNVL